MKKTAEDLLELNLSRCTETAAACLANAEADISRESPYSRANEMDRAVALLNASARLADALARLRGPTQTIRVTRGEVGDQANRTPSPDRGAGRAGGRLPDGDSNGT